MLCGTSHHPSDNFCSACGIGLRVDDSVGNAIGKSAQSELPKIVAKFPGLSGSDIAIVKRVGAQMAVQGIVLTTHLDVPTAPAILQAATLYSAMIAQEWLTELT
jgi:hypothetical protein